MAGEQEDESKELAGCHSAIHARRRTVDRSIWPTLLRPDSCQTTCTSATQSDRELALALKSGKAEELCARPLTLGCCAPSVNDVPQEGKKDHDTDTRLTSCKSFDGS